MHYSVVVIARDRPRQVLAALLALRAHGQPDDVLLVDNASDEDIQGVARITQLPLRVLRMDEHQSLGAACNAGLDAAQHDIVLLLHADTQVACDPGVAATWLWEHPTVGIVGARMFAEGDDPRRLRRLAYATDRWRSNPHATGEKKWDIWPTPTAVEAVETACMLIRRTATRFDERYWFRLEDADFCLQYAQDGWEIVSHPALRAMHLADGGLAVHQLQADWAARQLASQFLYHERWCSVAPLAHHPRQPGVRGELARVFHRNAAHLIGTRAESPQHPDMVAG